MKDSGKRVQSPTRQGDSFTTTGLLNSLYAKMTGSTEEKKKRDSGEKMMPDVAEVIQSNFYQSQIKDKLGKADIDEKLVAKVTGAKEVLRKQRP